MRRSIGRLAVLLLVLALPVAAIAQRDNGEIVRGVVRTADGQPVPGARVTVTGLGTFTRRATETNARGQYTVLFLEGEGEYVVAVHALGYRPVTGRARRTGESDLLVVDAILTALPIELDPVEVEASRGLGSDTADIGARSEPVLGGALFSLDPSALNALLARVPGLAMLPGTNGRPDGYSLLGVSPDQNRTVLDGTTFNGTSLPPGVLADARVTTTTYDAAQGNFAGGQLVLRTRPGTDRFQATLNSQLADPALSWADPRAPTPIPLSINGQGAASGPIHRGNAYYNLGVSDNTQTSRLVSLLTLNTAQRDQQGLSPDSLTALESTLGRLGVPLTAGGVSGDMSARTRSAFARFDYIPSATTTLQLEISAGDARTLGAGVTSLGFPSLGGGTWGSNFGAVLRAGTYYQGFVSRVTASLQRSTSRAGPFLDLPSGQVRMGAEYTDGSVGLTQLTFGGGTAGRSSNRTSSAEIVHELSRITGDSRHHLTFGQSFRLSGSATENATGVNGAYAYQSLADLAANQPASYTRTLGSVARSTSDASGALWLKGQSSFPGPRLQLEYGIRWDSSRPGTRPPENPAVNSAFGRRTDFVPQTVGVSPRLGFSWATVGPSPPAPVAVTIRGGVGAFRGVVPADRIAALLDATGLPNAIRQLTCTGDATPIPDWSLFTQEPAATPTTCNGAAAPAQFSADAPEVRLFSRDYRPPTSWRGNLDVAASTVAGWRVEVGGVLSRTLHAESQVDLNFRDTPAFTLANEGGRPVFVPPDAIVPSTGAVAPGASRLTPGFAHVWEQRADLRSEGVQLSVNLSHDLPWHAIPPIALQYTFNGVRQEQRGFGGSTAGDPLLHEWSPGVQPTHQVSLSTSFRVPLASITLQLALNPGTRYTPIVAGDVNGDGQFNDRAFVFDASTTTDTTLAREMRDLLATATPSTRACLLAQVGRIAGPNSCTTGWRLQPNLGLDLRLPWPDLGVNQDALKDHVHVSVQAINALGALLRLLGLEDSPLGRLSGVSYPIDPTLLYVQGFDTVTHTFRYHVNQQFGEGRPGRIRQLRYPGAFQVQIGAQVQLGDLPPRPSLVRDLGLVGSGRDTPPPNAAELRERLHGLTLEPIALLLRERDSLLLSSAQVDSLEARQKAFFEAADSLLAPVIDYIAVKGRKAKDSQVNKLLNKARARMLPLILSALHDAVTLLREEQRQRLPAFLRSAAKLP